MLAIFEEVASEDRVQVFSVSYGASEDNWTLNEQKGMDRLLRIMAAEGIAVFISSGDCGAFDDGIKNTAVVEAPASLPYAIATGGTELQMTVRNRRLAETAWSMPSPSDSQCHNDWGSGVSETSLFHRPAWQVGPGLNTSYDGAPEQVMTPELVPVQAPNGLRQVPDVAAAADNLCIFWQGHWVRTGGTSAAAPIWAAGTALVDQGLLQQGKPRFGSVPTIYWLANHPGRFHPFTDIVSGQNGFYRVAPGWDYVTGWGSPNFWAILQRLQPA
jgi:kumamolisin